MLRLAGQLPVPTLLHSSAGISTTEFVPGTPGQEAIAEGHAAEVLYACGRLLAQLQQVTPPVLFDVSTGPVLVHNDFGPNNVVMAPDLQGVRLLCDWEWVGVGDPTTDLAWAEFIVRLHHPGSVAALDALFDGYGHRPPWEARRSAMADRADAHRQFVRRWHGEQGESLWKDRLAAIATWRDV